MRLSDEQYEFIKGEVVSIFERYGVHCIPINGFELAYKMGIKLIPYSSLDEKKREAVMTISTDGFYTLCVRIVVSEVRKGLWYNIGKRRKEFLR